MKRKAFTIAVAVAAIAIALSGAAAAQNIGPSTTTEPYVLPARPGVTTTSILTTGDNIGGYRMVGIPDGTGAWNENHRTFNFVSNHELGRTVGVPRAHGSKGAFVSRWQIERGTLKVLNGRDHLTGPNDVHTWVSGAYQAGTTALERLCSADLPRQSAFSRGSIGTSRRIFLSGEETSTPFTADHGRVFAHVLTGPGKNQSWELPRLGKMSFENAVASPYRQDKTIVMLNDDAGRETNVTPATNVCKALGQTGCVDAPSELYVYVGTKQRHGDDIERAGLTNGYLYGVRVLDKGTVVTGENKDFVFGSTALVTSARFELHNFFDVSGMTGVEIQDAAIANEVTQFVRIEDGAWDPRRGRERDYYFVTTGRITTDATTWRPSRLWRLRFDDIKHPVKGGTIEMLLTNAFNADNVNDPGYQMFDNLTIDRRGRIVLQEDVGNNARLGRIYVYGIDSGKLELVAKHNPKFFSGSLATNPDFLTIDEESSGVIDASRVLGDGWFLLTVQNHKASTDLELVEGGQFVAMYIDPSIARAPKRDHDHHDDDDEDDEENDD
jgi:hypothetical protein